MVDIIYFILCLLSFINVNIKGLNSFFYDYMDLNSTKYIKGIFVWMIFFRHSTEYFVIKNINNNISIKIDKAFKQNLVSLFLFYSGYGIYESFKKKGNNYIKTLPIKSCIIFIKSQIILIFFLCNNLILGIKVDFKSYLRAIIFKKGIGNSYWFVFAIIMVYIYSFLSFVFIRKKKYNFIGIIFISIICYYHIVFVYQFYHKGEMISVDTIICFVLGFYYSFFKSYFDIIIMKNDIIYFGTIIFLILIYYKYYIIVNKNIYNMSLNNCFFTLLAVLITMKIKFQNEFLNMLSSHSYSIYLLQRIIMIYIYKKNYFYQNEFFKFFIEFIIVIFIAIIFDKYTFFIDKLLKSINNGQKKILKESKNIEQISELAQLK